MMEKCREEKMFIIPCTSVARRSQGIRESKAEERFFERTFFVMRCMNTFYLN